MATILSKTLRRAVLDTRSQLPPSFLLPWSASLTTATNAPETSDIPLPNIAASPKPAEASTGTLKVLADSSTSSNLSPSIRELLPLLRAQGSHYITAHVHDRPYLLTQGDTLRLPFHMRDVEPGDVIRLNRASNLGSRDYTLKAAAPASRLKSSTTDTTNILDPTTGSSESHSRVMPTGDLASATAAESHVPHFIPHIAKGKTSYIDDRLFVCRAVVMGVESEPMRTKEKTKRRQRKVKTVKSKHRFTVLKIKELRVRSLEEIESGEVV